MRKKQAFSETLFRSMGGVGITHREDTEAGVHSLSVVQGQNAVDTNAKRAGLLGSKYM